MSTKIVVPSLNLDAVLPAQTEEHVLQCAMKFLEFILEKKHPTGQSYHFQQVFQLLENGETEIAVLMLSEILRGPTFLGMPDYWSQQIVSWMKTINRQDPTAFSGMKVLPHRIFYNLTQILAYEESYLRSLLVPDEIMLK